MGKIYTSFDIKIAAFLGGPLAGAYLISKNYTRLGAARLAKRSIQIGVILTILFFSLLFLLPERIAERIPNFIFPIVFVGIAHYLVEKYQKHQLDAFLDKGGEKESVWKTIGISLLIALLTVLIAGIIFVITDLLMA